MLRVWRLIQGGYAIVKERETFASRLGFVLISAGCAIGLGNVWRFPYIVGQYGGAAFVLIYLLFLVIMGLPIMAMEFSVGRASRKSILASFQVLEPKGSKWHWYGWFGRAGNYLLMMFYTTIAGWLLLYFFKVAAGEFRGLDAAGVENAFGAMQGNVGIQLLFMGIVVVLGMLICSRGLKNGVEKVNKAMMLCLLALLVVLAVRALTLPGAMEGVKFVGNNILLPSDRCSAPSMTPWDRPSSPSAWVLAPWPFSAATSARSAACSARPSTWAFWTPALPLSPA